MKLVDNGRGGKGEGEEKSFNKRIGEKTERGNLGGKGPPVWRGVVHLTNETKGVKERKRGNCRREGGSSNGHRRPLIQIGGGFG